MIVGELRLTGYTKVIFRSDGEPALVAMMRAIGTRWGIEIIPQVSAPGDVKSHVAVECAVKIAKGQIRTLKSALEGRLDTTIAPDHPHTHPRRHPVTIILASIAD